MLYLINDGTEGEVAEGSASQVKNRCVVADPRLCIGCRTCEVACAVSHKVTTDAAVMSATEFNPRLKVLADRQVNSAVLARLREFLQQQSGGEQFVTTPVLCRQCEDKPCGAACPNQAIVSCDGVVKVDQARCIGCKSCVVACPYGAIRVAVRPVAKTGGLFRAVGRKAEALKCDLCSHRAGGPACVEVCPTQALRLVTPE